MPGAMQLTRILYLAYSIAATWVITLIPALAAQYATEAISGISALKPAVEEVLNDRSLFLFHHHRQDIFQHHEWASQIGGDDDIEVRYHFFVYGPLRPADSGIVEKDVYSAELFDGLIDHSLDIRFTGHIGRNAQRFYFIFGQNRQGFIYFSLVPGRYRHISPEGRHGFRHRSSQAPAAAGYQRYFPAQIKNPLYLSYFSPCLVCDYFILIE